MFLNCSTCFGRHTAHHQELKNCNCRYDGWAIAAAGNQKRMLKPEAAITVFELLMMGGVSPETCWAIKKHWNNKCYYKVASCWFCLWDLYYNAWIHEHQVNWILKWIEFQIILTLPLNFFVDIIKHLLENGHIKNRHKKQATLSIWKAEHNKQSWLCSKCLSHQKTLKV